MTKADNTELRSESVQELLAEIPNWIIRWGNTLLLLLILMLVFISWFIKYPDVITTEALITTHIPPQKEYAKITAKLDTILVRDGQFVKPGQPLAILENTANYMDVFLLKSEMDKIHINSNSFNFPFESLPVLFLGDIESDYALFETSYIQYVLNKKLRPFSNDAIAHQISLVELNIRLQNLKSQKELSHTELRLKEKDLSRNRELFESGVVSARDYEAKQLDYLQSERNFKNMTISISQIRETIGNVRKVSRGSTIDRKKEEVMLLKNLIQSFNRLKNSMKDWNSIYVLKSEVHGYVSYLSSLNNNQLILQGDLVFTLIPSENSSFVAKLRSPALNSGKIKIGQEVNIKVENYPDTEFGTLKGNINKISLFPDKDGFYLIDTSLPKTLVTSYNKKIEFKQEMKGSAEIITEDLRLIERFFYQLKNVFK